MKVLFVCSGNSEFGISPIIRTQGESLRNNGAKLDYFAIKGKGLRSYLRNIPKLKRFLKLNKYDIIHAHYGFCGIVSQFARDKEKLIVSFMGSDLLSSNNSDGTYIKLSRFYVGINKYFARFKFNHSIIKSKIMQSEIIKGTSYSVIPNGVDFKIFYPIDQYTSRRKLKINKEEQIILFVSDPKRKEKNFILAKNAVSLINSNRVKLKVVYNIPQYQLNWYYNSANILLLTSFYEGSPNVIKEAMACNCPIVSTDVGDVKEVIGKTEGCYITSFDPKDVAEKIKMALDFGKRTNGRNHIKHLEINNIAKKIINVYEHVLNS